MRYCCALGRRPSPSVRTARQRAVALFRLTSPRRARSSRPPETEKKPIAILRPEHTNTATRHTGVRTRIHTPLALLERHPSPAEHGFRLPPITAQSRGFCKSQSAPAHRRNEHLDSIVPGRNPTLLDRSGFASRSVLPLDGVDDAFLRPCRSTECSSCEHSGSSCAQ